MIKMKLFTDKEWDDAMRAVYSNRPVVESLDYFDRILLRPKFEKEKRVPFRDAESLRLLKESYDVVFASDEDWFSVIIEGRRESITCISEELKFALTAIDASKRGLYTMHMEFVDEKIWHVLVNLPVDILVAVKKSDVGVFTMLVEDADFVIENYPYKNQIIEVTVKNCLLEGNSFYTKVPDSRENGTGYGLHIGKDGKYYSSDIDVCYALQYYWKNDIKGIIEYIDWLSNKAHKKKAVNAYTVFEIEELVEQPGDCGILTDYTEILGCLKRRFDEKKIDESEYEEQLKKILESDGYKEYLYFRDQFKVIWHKEDFSINTVHRRLPMMMVDKNHDGTYFIHGDLTVKNPLCDEILSDVISRRSKERECFILIVDVEELLNSVEDVKKAVCGFRVLADSLEVFGVREAIRLFGEALKEACSSGKCTIDDDLY